MNQTRLDMVLYRKAGAEVTVPPLRMVTLDAVRDVVQLLNTNETLVFSPGDPIENSPSGGVGLVSVTLPNAIQTFEPGPGTPLLQLAVSANQSPVPLQVTVVGRKSALTVR